MSKQRATSVALLLCSLAAALSWAAQPLSGTSTSPPSIAAVDGSPPELPPPRTALRYDTDYPDIGYAERPVNNAIARLQARLDRGEVKLAFHPTRGYLDSLLNALGVDPSSQTLVYSKTSLQVDAISAATPRAIYFNDDTYVAWVQGMRMLELATMDSDLGQVFYTLPNRESAAVHLQREVLRCLNCHDTYSLSGGGVPRFSFMSSLVGTNGEPLKGEVPSETIDRTPIRDRWGGWYVTGRHGDQAHLGNILVDRAAAPVDLDSLRRGNLDTLDELFDTRPYLTDKSDIVALLVFEHQAYIQNLITRVNFKARTVMARQAGGALSPQVQAALKALMEPLVQAMLFVDAAAITGKITSGSGFDTWFQAQGPRDPLGRSLRELDLTTRLFKYPLSYLVYSDGFDGLPDYAKSYIYGRFAEILSGRDQSKAYSHLSVSDRKAMMEILTATKPAFARAAGHT